MPAGKTDLAGVRVLVTRPASRAGRLVALINRAGGEPVQCPTLDIVPVQPSRDDVDALARSDTVIFISPSAAEHGYPILRNLREPDRRVIAIGRPTKDALEKMGCRDVYDPGERSASEVLLEQPVLRDVADRRICIVRGQGGRELLRETLVSRGARVSYLECYRRALPARWDPGTLARVFDDDPETLVVISTSTAGLTNLLHMAADRHRGRLVSMPLVVIGGRQKAAALRQGWLGPVLEAAAGDQGIVETIIAWRRQCRGNRD